MALLIDRCYYLTSDELRRSPSRPGKGHSGSSGVRGTAKRGLGSKIIWGRAPNFKLAKHSKIFSETMPSGAYFFMISS